MNRTILIVDDEAHLRTLIQQTLEDLEDEGVELMTAANGEEALEKIQSVGGRDLPGVHLPLPDDRPSP